MSHNLLAFNGWVKNLTKINNIVIHTVLDYITNYNGPINLPTLSCKLIACWFNLAHRSSQALFHTQWV